VNSNFQKRVTYFIITMIAGGLSWSNGYAQTYISIEEAIQEAITHNPEMTLSDQRIEQQQMLKGAAYNFMDPQFLFQSPTGTEQRISIIQNFQYPGVYAAQHKTQKERVKLSESEKQITQNNLIYKVKNAYNETQFALKKVTLLQRKDSIYSNILNINEVRYRVGQISNLEKVNGEAKYKEIEYNLLQAKVGLIDAKMQLGLLLGKPNDSTFIPSQPLTKISADNLFVNEYDSSVYQNNPLQNYHLRMENVNRYMLKAEKRKRIPGILTGYMNQGPDHSTTLYNRIQFGLSLPIWYWSYNSSIRGAKKGVEMARTQRKITSYQLNTEYSRALAQFKQQADNLEYFEKIGLNQADEIIKSARESYRLGSISYYAFLQNIELAFQIEQNYLESLRNYNQSIIMLNFITGQNQ
jgi:outer membrane protein TolC